MPLHKGPQHPSYATGTAGQLASRVYDVFIAVEHWFVA